MVGERRRYISRVGSGKSSQPTKIAGARERKTDKAP
jgi:hypothetical protein